MPGTERRIPMASRSIPCVAQCGECGKDISFLAYPKISVSEDSPDSLQLKEQVLSGQLFQINCTSCGWSTRVQPEGLLFFSHENPEQSYAIHYRYPPAGARDPQLLALLTGQSKIGIERTHLVDSLVDMVQIIDDYDSGIENNLGLI
jgi:hypothetical protein